MKPARSLLVLCALLPFASCGVVAGAGIGYVISREVLPGAIHEATVAVDIDEVWPLACESLEVLHDLGTELTIDPQARHAVAEIDGSRVIADVLAYDFERTVVRIEAESPLARDPKTADAVMRNILGRIEREMARAVPASTKR